MARDPYEVVLADLRAKRDDIDCLIKSLEAFKPAAPVAGGGIAPFVVVPPRAPVSGSGSYTGLSIVDASRLALRARGEPMGNPDLASALLGSGLVMNSVEPANTISSVLHRAWQAGGDVVKVGRGRWGLAEWNPDKDFSAAAAATKNVSSELLNLPTLNLAGDSLATAGRGMPIINAREPQSEQAEDEQPSTS